MIRIITDTSTLYSVSEGAEKGIIVVPLSVTIDGKSYDEYEDISATEFVELIDAGHVPTSSQPPIGKFLEVLDEYKDDEVIVLSIADGLSGAYQSWLSAKEMSEHNNVVVINSKTLAYPHRILVEDAVAMRDEGESLESIVDMIHGRQSSMHSYLLPTDFEFLKRGGRLTPLAATMSGLLKIQPVVSQIPDGTRLEKFTVGRSFNIAVKKVMENLSSMGVDASYKFGISHAMVPDLADYVSQKMKEIFNIDTVDIFDLSCAFITQGGPHCLAIQVIK